jgi:hypothetical protein
MEEKDYQKKNLEAIFAAASYVIYFRTNKKYCVGQFAKLTPYIAYGDVMSYKYKIRVTDDFENTSDANPIIVEYGSIDELVNDGWQLD